MVCKLRIYTNLKGIEMNFNKIKDRIKEAFMFSGYSRTAKVLLQLNDRQLADIGISRKELLLGASAYPWRETVYNAEIPKNLTKLNTTKVIEHTPIMPQAPKAA